LSRITDHSLRAVEAIVGR